MREPPEVTHLRETLSRSHAIEAFRHQRGHDPDHDPQLESFIAEYVREAYSDGVENWSDLDAPRVPITRRAMNAPIGKILAKAGYSSLWHYFEVNGFNDLEKPITLEDRVRASQALYQVVFDQFLEMDDLAIAEIGCGRGMGCGLLGKNARVSSITGVDLNEEQIERATKINHHLIINCKK